MPTGVVYTYDNAGKLIKMEGYSDAGIKQWANLYDAANGRLTEQRGFYGSGALSQSIIVHVDGSKSATFFEASGRCSTSPSAAS